MDALIDEIATIDGHLDNVLKETIENEIDKLKLLIFSTEQEGDHERGRNRIMFGLQSMKHVLFLIRCQRRRYLDGLRDILRCRSADTVTTPTVIKTEPDAEVQNLQSERDSADHGKSQASMDETSTFTLVNEDTIDSQYCNMIRHQDRGGGKEKRSNTEFYHRYHAPDDEDFVESYDDMDHEHENDGCESDDAHTFRHQYLKVQQPNGSKRRRLNPYEYWSEQRENNGQLRWIYRLCKSIQLKSIPPTMTRQDLIKELNDHYGAEVVFCAEFRSDPEVPPFLICPRLELENVAEKKRILILCREARLKCGGIVITATNCKT